MADLAGPIRDTEKHRKMSNHRQPFQTFFFNVPFALSMFSWVVFFLMLESVESIELIFPFYLTNRALLWKDFNHIGDPTFIGSTWFAPETWKVSRLGIEITRLLPVGRACAS